MPQFRRTQPGPREAVPFDIPLGQPFTDPSQAGWTAPELDSAYQIPASDGGSGKIFATVVAYDAPNAESDLATYRSAFGMPACTTANGCFKKVAQDGSTNYPPATDVNWAAEATVDVEMASASCVNCHLLLVEANSAGDSDLTAAVSEAVKLGANVVNMSWGGSEFSGETSYDPTFNVSGVQFFASSGDNGGTSPYWPATSSYVVSVGGTDLEQVSSAPNPSGDLWSETAWSGATSGCSAYEAAPSWQSGTTCSTKATADVSADAGTAIAVYFTPPSGGAAPAGAAAGPAGNPSWTTGWQGAGGTSLSSPLSAALWALVGDPTALADGAGLDLYSTAFTAGAGAVNVLVFCGSSPCWSGPTGEGSPRGPFTRPGGTTSNESLNNSEGRAGPEPCWHGDPVICAVGNLAETATDLAIPGRGQPLAFARSYNSLLAPSAAATPLGYGWTDNYNQSLAVNPTTGAVTITQDDGTTVSFAPSGSGYSAAGWVDASLVHNPSGTYTYTLHDLNSYTFSSAGQLISESNRDGYVTTLSYNGSNQLASVTDPSGRKLSLSYNGSGQIALITDPANRVVSYAYDGAGNLASATDPAGAVTKYAYDSSHRLTSITDPRGGLTTNVYDSANRVTSQTDPSGRTTTYAYSSNSSNKTSTTTITDPNHNVTAEVFNQYDQLISLTKASGTSLAATSSYQYEPGTGELIDATDPRGNTTTYTWDAAGNELSLIDPLQRATTYTYDAYGDRLTATDPAGVTTTYTYTSHQEPASVSTPVGSSTSTTTYTYSSSFPGDLVTATDPDGHSTTYTYDSYGDQASATDADGNKNTYAYNAIGEKTSQVSPRGNVSGGNPSAYTTTYSYDGDGRLVVLTDPLGHTTKYAYDADGNQTSVTDAENQVTTYSYDSDNELTKVTRADGTTQSYGYDPDGNRTTFTDGNGHATTYAYDALNRVTSVTDPLGRATSYGYDADGNRTAVTDPQGRVTTDTYDVANQLTATTYSDGVTPNVSYNYDADGRRATMADGTGTTTYAYDALGRTTSTTNGGGQVVSYGYDLAGNVTSITYPDATVVAKAYDPASHLTSVTDGHGHTTTFSYNPDSNPTTEAYPNGDSATATFDAAENPASVTQNLAGGAIPFSYSRNPDNLVTNDAEQNFYNYGYTYDANNRVTSYGQGGFTYNSYSYDPADNLTTSPGGTAQQYDAADELVSAGGISFVGTSSASSSAASSVTVSLPTLTAPGDEIVVASAQASSGGVSTPAGYTSAGSFTGPSNGVAFPGTNISIFTKAATSTDTSVTLGYSGLPQAAVVVGVYQGVDPSHPVDAITSGGAASATSVTAPSLKSTVPGDELVVFQGASSAVTTTPSWTAPNNMVEEVQAAATSTFAGYADESLASPGPTGGLTSAFSASGELESVAVALEPTAAAYTYSAEGQRTKATNLNTGNSVSYGWDQAGRLTSYSNPGFGISATYAYNGDGLRISKAISGGATQHFAWDSTGSVPELLTDGTTDYVYGPAGQIVEQYTAVPAVALVGVAHGSGAAGTSVTVNLPAGTAAGDEIFVEAATADTSSSSLNPTAAGYASIYSVTSSSGSLTSPSTEIDVFDRTAQAADKSVTVTYTSVVSAAVEVVVYSGADTNYQWTVGAIDSGGNGSAASTTVTAPSVAAARDGDRLVVFQAANGTGALTGTWQAPSSMSEADQTAAGTVAAGVADQSLSTPGPTGTRTSTFTSSSVLEAVVVAIQPPPDAVYYHLDPQGSTRLLSDASGADITNISYDPWGNPSSYGDVSTAIMYVGQYTDAESGLMYLRSRYYDPATGQFLSVDPAAAITQAPYSYAGDDPVNAMDPLGLCSWYNVYCEALQPAGHAIASGAKEVWKYRAPVGTALGLVALAAATGGLAIPEEAATASAFLAGAETVTGGGATLLGGANAGYELANGQYVSGSVDLVLSLGGIGGAVAAARGADLAGKAADIGGGYLGLVACDNGL